MAKLPEDIRVEVAKKAIENLANAMEHVPDMLGVQDALKEQQQHDATPEVAMCSMHFKGGMCCFVVTPDNKGCQKIPCTLRIERPK